MPDTSEAVVRDEEIRDRIGGENCERLPAAPDTFDSKYQTTRAEIWSWYVYYISNSGLTLFNFAPTAFQNLVSQAAGDTGVLHFAGRDRTVNSIVLLSNGIAFAIQIVVFLVLGSFADFGTWRPNILIVLSLMGIALGFGWLGVHTAGLWEVAAGMYIVGTIVYQTSFTFWQAAFPALARNTASQMRKADDLNAGRISLVDYHVADSLKRNELSNIALCLQVCVIPICAVIIGILYALRINDSTENNNWGISVVIAFGSGMWLLLAIPWFVLEKRRKGQDIPPGMNVVTAGLWQLYRASVYIWKLKQSLYFLIGYFLLGDALNTTVTVVLTLQNEVVSYNSITLTYLLMVGYLSQGVGVYTMWRIQRKWSISTKTMFNAVAIATIILDAWGVAGIYTQKIGFHNIWEFWFYQVYFGVFVCAWFSFSMTMISEVTPRGKEFLFFSLFNIVGKTSSFIGPLVSSAIIDASTDGNNSLPFWFLFAVSIVSFLGLYIFVDLQKSQKEQQDLLDEEQLIIKRLKGLASPSAL